MKTLRDFLTESVTLTGSLVRQNMMEGYVNFFYSTLSKVSRGYKKPKDDSLYLTSGCGEIYDVKTKNKIVDKRPHYKLSNQILTHYGKVFYILEMDVDSFNALTMYRLYKDKSKLQTYRLIMLAKKNIMATLKEAGFSVRSDNGSIYASIKDYVKRPDDENGLVILNYHQKKVLKECDKLFSYEGVQPAYNRYAITLLNVRTKEKIVDEGNGTSCGEGSFYQKVVVTSNGKIEFYELRNDKDASLTLYGCFPPITRNFDEE